MPAESYLTDSQISEYINGSNTNTVDKNLINIMSTKINGIEGLPYQFMDTVDIRIGGTEIGRKYGEKIFSHLPLLFLTPCKPLFMNDFSQSEKVNVTEALLGGVTGATDLVKQPGKYYSVDFDYTEYFKYVNTMLTCLASFLFGGDCKNIKIPVGNKGKTAINKIDWSNELNDSFKTFFSAKENIVYYVDSFSQVDESFSNSTTESSLSSTINQFSDMANEIRFLFGSGGNAAASLINSATTVSENVTSSLNGLASSLAGGVVGSLASKGVSSVLNGGKIVFPKIWQNSSYDKSYSFTIKLRSPDHDSLSIFLNVLKPYCKLLALVLPRQISHTNGIMDPNAYGAPFLVKAYIKGMANIDMGMITSMNVTKGAECCWNDDGLPTQIDINITIEDLYSSLMMTSMYQDNNSIDPLKLLPKTQLSAVVNNTAYMDFLANMAGLNIAQMEVGRRIEMFNYLLGGVIGNYGSTVFTQVDRKISSLIGDLYKIL